LFFQAISDLHEISQKPRIPRDERAKARQLIRELYLAGFTPQEIEELTEVRWKSNTISKYCRGLEVKGTSGKNKALGLLKEFILIDGSWEELEYYVKTKKNLGSENLVLDDVIELKREIDYHGVDLSTVGSINAYLREKKSKWNWFLDSFKLVIAVLGLGYTFADLETLKEKTIEFGGLEPAIRTIAYAITEAEVQKKTNEFNKQIESLVDEAKAEERKLDEIMHQIKLKQFFVDYAEKLLNVYKFDPIALQTIITVAQNYGEPTIVLQALNTYGNLRKLEETVQTNIETLKAYDDDIIKLQAQKENNESQIADLYRRIGAIEEKHKQSKVLQNIANLLYNPTNAEISPDEYMLLSLSLLIGIRDYSFTHSAALPKWNIYVKNHVDNAVNMLNNIIMGKL
jgi:hypothetical protein